MFPLVSHNAKEKSNAKEPIRLKSGENIEIGPQVNDPKAVKRLHPAGQTAAVAPLRIGLKTKKDRRPGAAKPHGAIDLFGDFRQQHIFVKGQQRFRGGPPMAVLSGDPQARHRDITNSHGGQQYPQLIAGKTAFARKGNCPNIEKLLDSAGVEFFKELLRRYPFVADGVNGCLLCRFQSLFGVFLDSLKKKKPRTAVRGFELPPKIRAGRVFTLPLLPCRPQQ